MGAGILPVAFHQGKVYLLISRESLDMNRRCKGQWSDFGGAPEGNETSRRTAIREGWEESAGALGSQSQIADLIRHKLLKKVALKHYTTYVVEIPYAPGLPGVFSAQYRMIRRIDPQAIRANNGLYEKDKLKWCDLASARRQRRSFRRFYRTILDKVIAHFEEQQQG